MVCGVEGRGFDPLPNAETTTSRVKLMSVLFRQSRLSCTGT